MAQSVTACPLASPYPAPAPNCPGAGREALDVAFGVLVVPGPDVAAPWRPRPPDWDCSHSLLPRPRVPAGSLLTEAPSVALPLLLCPCVLRLSISLSLYLLLPVCLCPSLRHGFPKGLPAPEPSVSPGHILEMGICSDSTPDSLRWKREKWHPRPCHSWETQGPGDFRANI